jgi:hypothetical protein
MRNLQVGGRWFEPSIAHFRKARFAGKIRTGKGAWDRPSGPLTATVLQPVGKGVFEGSAGVLLCVGEGESGCVEGDGYSAVAEVLLQRSRSVLLWKEVQLRCAGGGRSGWGGAQPKPAALYGSAGLGWRGLGAYRSP